MTASFAEALEMLLAPEPKTKIVNGVKVSEVLFRPDDGFPLCYGYMVGPDDGKSGLYPTPEEAIEAHRQSGAQGGK